MARKHKGLTEKQRRFVEAFLGPAEGNGTRAAIMAGCPRSGAATQAWRLLRNVDVQKALVRKVEAKEQRGLAAADERDQFLTDTLRNPVMDMTHRMRAADMLNRVEGRYSVTHILKGRVGIEQVIAMSREDEPK